MTNRIKELREAAGLSQEELASKVHTSGQQIGRLENGSRRLTIEWVMRLAKALNVPSSELLPRDKKGQPSKFVFAGDRVFIGRDAVKMAPYNELSPEEPNQYPVYSGGGEKDPFIMTDPVEYRRPPYDLTRVRDVYGVLITGECMTPAFDAGDIAWVNPHLPPQQDSFVVLYNFTDQAEAMLARLVSWTADEWTIRRYGKQEETTAVSREDWIAAHRVVWKRMK